MPVLRAAGRNRIPLRRAGACRVPDDPYGLTDEQWAHYVFFRANTKGKFAERWVHSAGCRRWFNAVRDTATYRFQDVYRMGEQKPVIS